MKPLFLGVHIPMLTAIFEYGALLAMKKYYKQTCENNLDIDQLGKKMDKYTFYASLTFIILFDIIYWIVCSSTM